MIASRVATRTAMVAARNTTQKQQKRGIVDYLTNYPDKVMEKKKIQNLGGTCLGESNPTWLKQPGDVGMALFGLALVGFGFVQATVGHYRLATGKGKKPI
mmetsp:Transcript_10666/g.15078  ORF Transcript_10666/g.15078 Transcript_10666/m.15078 type:complete len:100 (-) Transcript_10666:194-493(-)